MQHPERPSSLAPAAGPASSALSFSLYRQSAAQGNVASLLSLGDAYFYGRGVEQDWVRSAAVYYEAYQVRGGGGYIHHVRASKVAPGGTSASLCIKRLPVHSSKASVGHEPRHVY